MNDAELRKVSLNAGEQVKKTSILIASCPFELKTSDDELLSLMVAYLSAAYLIGEQVGVKLVDFLPAGEHYGEGLVQMIENKQKEQSE